MANPRKFSEKIALHTQKQAEETAAFEAIIREVTATTRQATGPTQLQQQQQQQQQVQSQQHHLCLSQPNLSASARGRSLPNVNQIVNGSGIDLQDALSSLENMKQAVDRGHTITDRPLRERSPQSQKRYILNRHRDCSPYGSIYLCPPSDVNWRRASSDSALHSSVMATPASQNIMQSGSMMLANGTQGIENGQFVIGGGVVGMDFTQSLESKTLSEMLRPKSRDVPGINIFPSPESAAVAPGIVHMSIPNSTGSLPNLTTLSFSLPLSMPIDIDPVCCGPGGISTSYPVAEPHVSSGGGTMPLRLHRHAVPVPLVLHGTGQFIIGANGTAREDKLVTLNNSVRSSKSPDCRDSVSSDWSSYSNRAFNNSLRGSLSPPLIVITPDEVAKRSCGGRYSEPLTEFGFVDPSMECGKPVTNCGSWKDGPKGNGRSFTPPPTLRYQNGRITRTQRQEEAVEDIDMVGGGDDIFRRHYVENLAQYGLVNNSVQSSMASPSSSHYSSPVDANASAHLLYTVAQRSSLDPALASPVTNSDMSPHSILSSHMSPGDAVSPQWFSHSAAPSSPPSRQRDAMMATGELSPAHASALQQRFQQFNMVPDEQLVAGHGGNVNGGVGLYSFTAQPVHLHQQQQQQQLQQQTMPVLQHQQQTITVPQVQPMLASAGLVLVPAHQANSAGTPFVWQVGPSSFTSSMGTPCSQVSFAPAENPAFFRVAAAAGRLPTTFETACHEAGYGSGFGSTSSPQIAATAIHLMTDFTGQQSPDVCPGESSSIPSSSSIPDIVLTAEDLPVYSNQPLAAYDGTMDDDGQQDMSSNGGINPLSYLGDSFDGSTDLFTAEDALKLGLDPLEIEELQMLADASIITDPATEDSFRLERQ